MLQQVRWEAILSLWTNGYEYATILAPAMLTAPRYFAGEIEFGVIAQARGIYRSSDRQCALLCCQGRSAQVSATQDLQHL